MKNKTLKVECLQCNKETNHVAETQVDVRESSDDNIFAGASYQIIRCCGCDMVSFREESWCSEDIDAHTGDLAVRERLYPSRTDGRTPVKAAMHMPASVSEIYEETLSALNAKAPILAAIGLRALVEAVCLDQGSPGANLKAKIDGLVTTGALSTKQAVFLHEHRFMGNEAAHEMVAPSAQDLLAALEIMESVLQTLYELPVLAKGLETSRTRRRSKKKVTRTSKKRPRKSES